MPPAIVANQILACCSYWCGLPPVADQASWRSGTVRLVGLKKTPAMPLKSMAGAGWSGLIWQRGLGNNLLFDGRAAFLPSNNSISPLGNYDASSDTTRRLVSGALIADCNRGGWRFSHPCRRQLIRTKHKRLIPKAMAARLPPKLLDEYAACTFGPAPQHQLSRS